MGKPLAVDLFCGGGGTCLGLQQAGFEVVGVDIEVHKHYPGEFIQGDALHPPIDLREAAMIWASPPCQGYSVTSYIRKNEGRDYPLLIPKIQEMLKEHPFTVIENVPSPHSPIRPDVVLTGRSMGLRRIRRVRWFETSFFMLYPEPILEPRSDWKKGIMCTITTSLASASHFYPRKRAGLPGKVPVWEAKEVMGIPAEQRMTAKEIGEAVPPPYAAFIGAEIMRRL